MKLHHNPLQVVVIGLGQFGTHLAVALSRQCQVLAIDRNQEKIDQVSEQVQRAVCLDARDYTALRSVVGAEVDETVVSMGETMEASILCTLHLQKIGVRCIRAKAVNDDHATILRSVGATEIIFPERETADRRARQILHPNLLDFVPLEQDYRVVDVQAPCEFGDRPLAELQLRKRYGVFILAVKQPDRQAFVFLPGPEYVVRTADVLVMIGKEQDLLAVSKKDTVRQR
ncbi:MAG: potassium transporter TrkA [Deltaproteobacteria bacterium RIFOXYA12_FULL_61_11]|nr:MAG: potassium transporter TrkA [Deltaproteobacteria bacterium RIFOXYA12_FULL_61_11]